MPFLSCSGWGLHGSCVSTAPVSSYLTISTLPRHYPFRRNVSVALSLQLPAADVIRHPCPAEPGLSSRTACRARDRPEPGLSSCISTRSPGLPKILLYYISVKNNFKLDFLMLNDSKFYMHGNTAINTKICAYSLGRFVFSLFLRAICV